MQRSIVSFTVNANPLAQPRPKARSIGVGIQIYTPNSIKNKAYKACVLDAFKATDTDSMVGPLKLTVLFYIKRAGNMTGPKYAELDWRTSKPDADNLVKAVMDALNEEAWHDDSQVVSLHVEKRYAGTYLGGKSGRKSLALEGHVEVTIEELKPVEVPCG